MPGKLQAAIKQSKPFVNVKEEALLNLWRTADLLRQPVEQVLKERGISHSQYNVLRILRGAGKDGLACGEIGARMITRDPDVTRLLDRMERSGFARRSRLSQDRRVVLARITAKGLKLLDELDHPLLQLVEQTLGHMKDPALKSLIDLLEEARQGQ